MVVYLIIRGINTKGGGKKMKRNETVVYTTDDGKSFLSKEEAIKHEEALKNVKVFLVHFAPDLTEGRGYSKSGLIWVNAKGNHRDFAEHWCYSNLGNRIAFVMGVYGSNALMPSWVLTEFTGRDSSKISILARLEEEFVKKLWSE
ncbi:hypothetical protein D3C71_1381570 [compost metagenome]